MLSCLGFPECRAVQFFPPWVLNVKLDPSLCHQVSASKTNSSQSSCVPDKIDINCDCQNRLHCFYAVYISEQYNFAGITF